MSIFTKNNNPSKRRKRRRMDYTERSIAACKEMLIDKKIGYNIPVDYYKEKYKV